MTGAVEPTPEQVAAHDDQRDLGEDGRAALAAAYRDVFAGAGRLLDAGGGSGVAVAALQGAAPMVVLLDWSFSMLAGAGRAGVRTRCAGDLRRLPFVDGAFDGVHAAYAIQNVSEWPLAVAECVRVSAPLAPVVVAWGGPPADERLAGLEAAYFAALGDAAGVRAERSGLTLEGANELFGRLGKPLRRTFGIDGTQTRTPRQVVERLALNPYRSRPSDEQRAAATAAALARAQEALGGVDEPVGFRVGRLHHVYVPEQPRNLSEQQRRAPAPCASALPGTAGDLPKQTPLSG